MPNDKHTTKDLTERITIRCTPDFKRRLRIAAATIGENVTEFLLRAIEKQIKAVMARG